MCVSAVIILASTPKCTTRPPQCVAMLIPDSMSPCLVCRPMALLLKLDAGLIDVDQYVVAMDDGMSVPVGGGMEASAPVSESPLLRMKVISSPEHWMTSTERFLFGRNIVLLCLLRAAALAAISEFIWMNASPDGVP